MLPCMWSSNVCHCWLSAKLQEILKSASHCYGSHLHFALEAKVNTQSLILLFSPSVAAGRWVCNLHWLYQESPDKMKILSGCLREDAYAKCDPSSVSEPVFQHSLGSTHPTTTPCVCHCEQGGTQPTRMAGQSLRTPLLPLPHLHRQSSESIQTVNGSTWWSFREKVPENGSDCSAVKATYRRCAKIQPRYLKK